MNLVFEKNKQVELSFKVGVVGTSDIPNSVFVSISNAQKSISFYAKLDGDVWKATINASDIQQSFDYLNASLSINVALQGRIFTPYKTPVNFSFAPVEVMPVAPEVMPSESQVELVVTPEVQEDVIKPEIKSQPKIKETKAVEVKTTESKPVEVKPRQSLIKMVEPKKIIKIESSEVKVKEQIVKEPEFSVKRIKVLFK